MPLIIGITEKKKKRSKNLILGLEYFVDLEPEWKYFRIQFNVTYRLDNANTLIVDGDEMKINFNRR